MRVDEDERLHGHCPDCGQWKRLHGVIGSTTRRCARCRGAAIARTLSMRSDREGFTQLI